MKNPSPNIKPLPLKQRTSSVDARRDYNVATWTSLMGLIKAREYVITSDHFSIWKRHLAWAMENGKELRDYMTQRYASSMVFLSLMLSAELGVLFNSAHVTNQVRLALMNQQHGTVSFWIGMLIILSAILTLLGLIATYTAWTMVSAVSEANAHCIFRSSIGQYVAELPGRFIVGAIYSFLLWLILFFFLLLPVGFWSLTLLVVAVALFVHTISAFSAFGRVIMHTGAMGSKRIFDASYESSLLPHTLHENLLTKCQANLANNTSIMRQYRSKTPPIERKFSVDELSEHLRGASVAFAEEDPRRNNSLVSSSTFSSSSDHHHPVGSNNHNNRPPDNNFPPQLRRKRTESLVKFADGYDTNGMRYADFGPPPSAVAPGSSASPMSVLTSDPPPPPSSSSSRGVGGGLSHHYPPPHHHSHQQQHHPHQQQHWPPRPILLNHPRSPAGQQQQPSAMTAVGSSFAGHARYNSNAVLPSIPAEAATTSTGRRVSESSSISSLPMPPTLQQQPQQQKQPRTGDDSSSHHNDPVVVEKWLRSSSNNSLEGLEIHNSNQQQQQQNQERSGNRDEHSRSNNNQHTEDSPEDAMMMGRQLGSNGNHGNSSSGAGSRPVIPSEVTAATRNQSQTLSILSYDDDQHLTEDEKFDRDYGDLFGPDGYQSPSFASSSDPAAGLAWTTMNNDDSSQHHKGAHAKATSTPNPTTITKTTTAAAATPRRINNGRPGGGGRTSSLGRGDSHDVVVQGNVATSLRKGNDTGGGGGGGRLHVADYGGNSSSNERQGLLDRTMEQQSGNYNSIQHISSG